MDVDTDRYVIDGTPRQVMLSGRELAIERNAQAASWVNQRVIYTHGIGITMVPVNEVTPEGQPRLWVNDLPPRLHGGAGDRPAPDLLRRGRPALRRRARQAGGVRLPARHELGRRRRDDLVVGRHRRPLDSTLNRLLFALRFRDLDLLISDQVTADSQLLFHRTMADRMPRIAPFLRYDKDPYLVVDERGHLVYVQDAYTISDKFPTPAGSTGRSWARSRGSPATR